MPELPEVETTRRGLAPHVAGRRVQEVILRRQRLRWPIAEEISQSLPGQRILGVKRRAKYLLLETAIGSPLIHLGMSGSLRVIPASTPLRTHDHVDLLLEDGQALRFNDPRRFGCLLWQAPGQTHPLLQNLGPEPLTPEFNGEYLHRFAQGRKAAVKTFLMTQSVVVGVGNIYASEALFAAGIAPQRQAGKISLARYQRLADEVKNVLSFAITRGGTTLRDFISPDGLPGYFEQELQVYGRSGLPCRQCGRTLQQASIGGRSSPWCPGCQH